MLWTMIGTVAACLTMFGFVPQIVKMSKTRSVKDVSELTLIQYSMGVALWLLYGIHIGDLIVIVANAISLMTLLVALGLYLRLRGNEER